MPPKSHEAAWSKALFPDDASTVSREAFEAAFLDADAAAVDAAWRSLTTAPTLTRGQMASRLKQKRAMLHCGPNQRPTFW